MKSHLKRLTAPKSWKILRKTNTFLLRPNPGTHSMDRAMPLGVIMRDMLKVAATMADVKKILVNRHVTVDNKRITEIRHLAGLMDVISFKETKEHYRVIINKKGLLEVIPINEKEAMQKLKRIINKSKQKGGSLQVNFFDGNNMITKEKGYKVGDTLLMEFPGRIVSHLKLEPGVCAYITGGKHIGTIATVENIQNQAVTCKTKTGTYICRKSDVFVVGEKQPAINLGKST